MYVFATAPFRISLYMGQIWFLFYQCNDNEDTVTRWSNGAHLCSCNTGDSSPAVATASKQVAAWGRSKLYQFIIERRVECQAVPTSAQLFKGALLASSNGAPCKLWRTPWALGQLTLEAVQMAKDAQVWNFLLLRFSWFLHHKVSLLWG